MMEVIGALGSSPTAHPSNAAHAGVATDGTLLLEQAAVLGEFTIGQPTQ
jgi:hypothetical protein